MVGNLLISLVSILLLIIGKTAIIWAPLLLGRIAFFFWHHFAIERFIGGIEWTVLEIEIPRVIEKTPLAMELFFTNAFYHISQKGTWEEYWIGAVHLWFSLEIVSIEGKVHFFIRTPSRIRPLVETQMYAQYPQVKIHEVEDYTLRIPRYRTDGSYYMWGCEFSLLKQDFYKIKTYVDYKLDKLGEKEEFKVDPITSTIEYMGSLGRGQELWMQFIIRATKKKFKFPNVHGSLGMADAALEGLKELMEPYTSVKKDDFKPSGIVTEMRTPDLVKPRIESIQSKITKPMFDCGIRLINIYDKGLNSLDDFNNARRASRLLFRQYSGPYSNSFERINSTQFDRAFSDPTGLALQKYKRRTLTFYKLRTMYYPPLIYSFKYPKAMDFFFPSGKPEYFVLNTEELATIFHFPGMVSETPTFSRIESKTAKPPANLPI